MEMVKSPWRRIGSCPSRCFCKGFRYSGVLWVAVLSQSNAEESKEAGLIMMMDSRVHQSRSCSGFFLFALHVGTERRREAYLKPAGVLGLPEWLAIFVSLINYVWPLGYQMIWRVT